MSMGYDRMKAAVDRHAELEQKRRDLVHEINGFQHDVKKNLLEEGLVDALSINWSMLRRMTR